MTFGEIVCEARSGAGWSLRDLARELAATGVRVSHVHLHIVEHDRRVPSRQLTDALRKVLMLDRRYDVQWIADRPSQVRVALRR